VYSVWIQGITETESKKLDWGGELGWIPVVPVTVWWAAGLNRYRTDSSCQKSNISSPAEQLLASPKSYLVIYCIETSFLPST
jgi:hypothetical protein